MSTDNFQYTASVALDALKNIRVYFKRYPDALPWSVRAALNEVETVVIWTAEMHQAATTGAQDAFTGTIMPTWPDTVPSFWWFRDFSFGASIDGSPGYRSNAALFVPVAGSQGGLATVSFVHPDSSGKIEVGLTVDRAGKVIASRATCGWLAMKAFMETEIAQLDHILLDRPTRRRAQKNNEQLPDVRIIQLRRRSASSSGEGVDREYHHRWIVKGHWRRLAQPRKADGVEVTFVSAYVKGPEGAPLLQPRESVYVVAR